MTGQRAVSIMQLGVLVSSVSLLVPLCSVALAESATKADSAASLLQELQAKNFQSQGQAVDEFEALLCGPQTLQSPECEGYQHHKAGRLEAAIEKYKTALALTQGTQDPRMTAVLYLHLGVAYGSQRQYEISAKHYREAAKLFRKSGDVRWAAAALHLLGSDLASLGQNEEALASYLEAFATGKDHLQLEKESDRALAKVLMPEIVLASIQLGKAEEALGPLTEAVEIFRQKGETKLVAQALDYIEKIYINLKDPKRGLAYLAKVLERSQIERDRYLESEVTYLMGLLLYEAKNPAQSLSFQERALKLCEEANNTRRAVDVLGELGAFSYYKQGKADKALEYYGRALKLSQDLEGTLNAQEEKEGLLRSRGGILMLAGKIHADLGQYERAVEFYRRARENLVEAGARQDGIGVLWPLSAAYSKLGRPQDAFLSLQQEQEEEKEQGISEWQIKAFINLARSSDVLGESDKSGKYIIEAVLLSKQIGKPQQEASALIELGRLCQNTARYEAALTFFQLALGNYREAKDQKGQGEVLRQIGHAYLQIGDEEAATRWYREALAASRAAQNTAGEAHTLSQLLLVDADRGNEETYNEDVRQADKALREILQWLSAQQKAMAQQTSDIAQSIDHVSAVARLGQVVGILSSTFGEGELLQEGIKRLNSALQMHQQLPRTREVLRETAVDLYFLGRAYSRLKQYDEALKDFQQAEAIARSFNSPEIITVLYRIGTMQEEQGRLQEALALYTQADELFEQISVQQRSEEVKIPLRESGARFYQHIVDLLFKFQTQKPEEHYAERAFLYQEKGKARALLDLLAEAKVRVREGISPALLKEEEQVTTTISRIHRMLANPDLAKDQKKQLLTTLVEREQAWQALQVKMAATNPKYTELPSAQTVGIPQVQAILDKETLLLEYALGAEKSFLWAITHDGMQVYELPAEEVIAHQMEQYLPTLRAPLYGKDEIGRHIELGRGLYQTLLQPAASQLQGKNKLIIVPDGNLYYLPFETLIADVGGNNDKKSNEPSMLQAVPYLVKDYTITYTPSASVLVTLEKNRDNRRQEKVPAQAPLLAFGDPIYEAAPVPQTVALNMRGAYEERGGGFQRLAYSAREVEKIAGVYGITLPSDAVNLEENATEKRLHEIDLTRYRILHFATHAIVGDEVKWITQPALVLSLAGTDDTYDGFLQMSEIFNLRLDADLVVLSACDTGTGKLRRGEGIIGLTRAFMYAGTPSVVASLWKVNDQSTSLFMEFFYRNLKEGQSKADALRQAKKQLMQTRAWSNTLGEEQSFAAPYFWAPFILIGSGN